MVVIALTQPILYSQAAFDATQSHVFTFNVIGGDQVVANRLTIKNSSNTTVYNSTETTFTLTHTLPANTLTNGNSYTAYLNTKNSSNNFSSNSNTIQFYCYSNPTFDFTNITNGASLTTSSYNFQISYNQSQGERLQEYAFNLYDYGSNLISTSGTIYTNAASASFTAQYTFGGFSNGTSYYIECTGITTGGTQITTGLIQFGINYNSSSTKLNLVNNCKGGYVYVSAAPVAIFGFSDPYPPVYYSTDANPEPGVNLRVDGDTIRSVWWEEGFTTSTTDWTLTLWTRWNNNGEICIMNNGDNDKIIITFQRTISSNSCYCTLEAIDKKLSTSYKIYSNTLIYTTTDWYKDWVKVWVRRINNLYDIVLSV